LFLQAPMKKVQRGFFFLFIITVCFSCGHSHDEMPLFELMDKTGIDFTNKAENDKDFNIFTYRNFYNGGGVAIGDLNNDGLSDIFFTANQGANKLYLNKGNWKFEDISVKAGFTDKTQWSTGVVLVDINNDGWLDIFVSNSGSMKDSSLRKNQLFINNHDLTFTESAEKYGLANTGYTTQVSFFDYDMDGDLDCFIINNSPIPVSTLNYANQRDLPAANWPVADFLKGGGDHLLRNDNGHFVDVTSQSGIHGSLLSFGLGLNVADINGDGYPDIYVSNDFYERDYLYINQKNGRFKDETEEWLGHTSLASMGADIADINNDGYPDIFTTDMLPENDFRLKTTTSFDNIQIYTQKEKSGFYHQYMQNCLQVNNGNGKFFETARYSRVSASDWSWGALLFDADNDGLSDIYITNGIYHDLTDQDFINFFANDIVKNMVLNGKKEEVQNIIDKMPSHPLLNMAYQNKGNLNFEDKGKDWGFTEPSYSNGAAYGDLDNDGDLDLVVNNENGPAFIFKNNARSLNKNNYIGILLKGGGKNSFAIGSNIKIYANRTLFTREVMPSRGFQSSVDYKQIVGLGTATEIDSMIISWPDRSETRIIHPAINQVHTIPEPDNRIIVPEPEKPDISQILLRLVKSDFEKHAEDDYSDFYNERNLPKLLSREGPKATTGDVNGDGLTDVYIGGTPGHPGQLYLQTRAGVFARKTIPAIEQFLDVEDEAVKFFDADHDGDLDLFIGPGGNNNDPQSRQMQNRLFINDGKGNFKLEPDAFPDNPEGMNTAVAIAYDFNHDGFEDLFIGGRSIPKSYGYSPRSYLFVNDGKGHFTDMAGTKNPDIAHIGMVTDAAWSDIIGDKEKELVIVGEWMCPRIFSFKGDHFEEVGTSLQGMDGWWESLAITDVNGDGKPDLILGNVGDNFYLHPDSLNPVKLWLNDFDLNGIHDDILTRTVQDKDFPVFLKHEMEDQIPSLKKQNLKNNVYAGKAIQDLFPESVLKSTTIKNFNYTHSVVAFNQGNGKFTIRILPIMAQLSSVNAIQSLDVNGDGFTDLILGGNEFGFLPQFGRLDASFGQVFLNDGKGNFEFVKPVKSGLQLTGQVRCIAKIADGTKKFLLFLRNDDFPVLYAVEK
jgi:enediyne biosynthesis protein E4